MLEDECTDEALAYWYLRLNGFLTLPNVMIHPDTGVNPRGEIDVLGVRFPHRCELLVNSMQDAERFTTYRKPLIVVGEATRKWTKINDTWRTPSKSNIERILRLIGAFPPSKTGEAAAALYQDGAYADEHYHIILVAFGARVSAALEADLPCCMQICWAEVIDFIFSRFEQHRRAKLYHQRWDGAGQRLWSLYEKHRTDTVDFCSAVVGAFRLGEAG